MTILTNVYNEEYLMPWWLEHHLKICDTGIVLDYNSTDSTLDIVRTMAPHWKIVQSKTKEFGAISNDQQMMELEATVSGYKMCLNTTEFLFYPDLPNLLARGGTYTCRGVYLADPRELHNREPDPSQPLLKQRHWGFYERENVVSGVVARERLLHQHSTGAYYPGRHNSYHQSSSIPDLLCVWTGCAPFTERLLARRLQIQTKMPQSDKDQGLGWGHLVSREDLLEGKIGFNKYEPTIRDMLQDETYKTIWEAWYGN